MVARFNQINQVFHIRTRQTYMLIEIVEQFINNTMFE